MPDSEQKNTLEVHTAESGQKLLQFLMRRLSLPQPLLHRWIRTGQVRINGGRAKPFAHVSTGDMIRIPPFALGMNQSATFEKHPEQISQAHITQAQESQKQEIVLGPLPPVVYADEHILIYNKPSGLPVHGGTGHSDSLAQRLEAHFSKAPFKPTPAHRLDKDTSGLICVAQSYKALRALQEAFAAHTMQKEYLAVVHGSWPHEHTQRLTHTLAKKMQGHREKVYTLPKAHAHAQENSETEDGKEAISLVRCIARSAKHSLMHIRLITGRTHQIRVQMAHQGHPIVGDGKYGAQQSPLSRFKNRKGPKLYLHSLRLTLPTPLAADDAALSKLAGQCFAVLPPWEKEFAVTTLPPQLDRP